MNAIENARQLEFSIFCIENVAKELNMSGNTVYDLLGKKSDILNNYIVPGYEALHTQSKSYIVNDIIDYMREKGLIR